MGSVRRLLIVGNSHVNVCHSVPFRWGLLPLASPRQAHPKVALVRFSATRSPGTRHGASLSQDEKFERTCLGSFFDPYEQVQTLYSVVVGEQTGTDASSRAKQAFSGANKAT